MLLSDLGTWPSLKTEITEFLEEMTDYQREQFDSWCRDNLSDIDQGDLSLQTDSQVVYFEAGKDMKVKSLKRTFEIGKKINLHISNFYQGQL